MRCALSRAIRGVGISSTLVMTRSSIVSARDAERAFRTALSRGDGFTQLSIG